MGSVPGLGRFPEQEMAIYSSILAWKSLWTEKPSRLQSWVAKSRTQLKQFSSSSSRYADDTTLIAESEEELKSL